MTSPAITSALRSDIRNAYREDHDMPLARPVYIRYMSSALEGPSYKTIRTFNDAVNYTLATSHFMHKEEGDATKIAMDIAIMDIARGRTDADCFGETYNAASGIGFEYAPGKAVLRAYELSSIPWDGSER